MVDVAEPSLAFVALCAFATERDLHYLRRLGRSCARCAELFWARDGKARHRALQLTTATNVRSLHDDAPDAPQYEGAEREPLGLLAFIDIIDDALEHGNLPFNDLFLLARRTMQDDRHVLLYLLVFGVITDRTLLVERITAMGEDWHDGVPVADPPSLVLEKPVARIRNSSESQISEADEELASAMRQAVSDYRKDEVAAAAAADASDTDSYETESETQADGQEEADTDAESTSVEAASRSEVSSSARRHINDFFSAWWPALGVHNTPVLRKYFAYLYPSRTDLVFEDSEAFEQMTLAERLVALAAIWSAQNVAQLLLSTPVFRCNTSCAVLFACCNKLQTTLSKSADQLAAVDDVDRRVLRPAGVARLRAAVTNPCASLTHHFRKLGADAAYCDALARFVDPKQRPLLDDDDLALLRGSVRFENEKDDDVANEESKEPAQNFDIGVAFVNQVEYLHVFWFACERDDVTLAREMVEKRGVPPHANENYAVRIAARYESTDVLDWLFTIAAVDPGAANNAALCTAVDVGATRAVRWLLAFASAHVDAAACDNYPLCRATERGDIDIVRMLLASDAVDVNARESTPFLNALRGKAFDIAQLLYKQLKFAINPRALGALAVVFRELSDIIEKDYGDDDDDVGDEVEKRREFFRYLRAQRALVLPQTATE